MKGYLRFGRISKHFDACKSGHYIHLTQPELLDEAIAWVRQENLSCGTLP